MRDFAWTTDQTVLLCVDQVVVHHCEMGRSRKWKKDGRSDQDECERNMMRENDKQLFWREHTSRNKVILSHTRENIACAKVGRLPSLFRASFVTTKN